LVNFYTHREVKDLIFINNPNSYFENHFTCILKTKRAEEIIKNVENTFGLVDYNNLSSSSKALLTANYNKHLLVNLICSGRIVIDEAIRLCEKYDDLDLNFYGTILYIMLTKKAIIRINGNKITTSIISF